MIPVIVRTAVLAGSVFLVSHGLAAQRLASAQEVPQQARDSASLLARSRSAQAGFERFRYVRLPRTHQSVGGGECHEIIGRFCFWFDPEPNIPPPEAPAISERRRQLLDRLAAAGDALPGDAWIAGQRVRYLVEAGDEDAAIAYARACKAGRWWCAALEGYALHEAQRFTESQAAFDTALALMPAEEREKWTDVSDLLRPEDQREYRRAPAEERARLARRLWWLSDPLWSDAGNDRLTEHYARWTMHVIQQRARQVDRLAWRDDMREIVVRYGWFTAWERYEPLFYYGSSGGGTIAYNDPRTWEWLVPLSRVREPRTLVGDEWPLLEATPTATRYAPEHTARVMALPHQVAVFPRPSGAVLVAGYALPADSLPADPRIRAAAVVMTDADAPRAVSPWQPTAATGAFQLELPASPAVLSLEVREDSTRTLARQRQGIAWNADARVSDLLLLAHPEARPEDLDEAARIARGSAEVRPGERVGVFWEMYGLPAGDSVTIRVGLMSPQAGWARRRLEAVGIARGARPVRMGWREEMDGEAVAARSVTVGIPRDLRPGEYTLEVSVSAPGRPAAIARRKVTVGGGGPPAR
jgi:hypothetical protein